MLKSQTAFSEMTQIRHYAIQGHRFCHRSKADMKLPISK